MTSGYVIWPTEAEGYRDSHEGGLWSYAFWRSDAERFNGALDSTLFNDCISPDGVILLPQQDVVCDDPDRVYDSLPYESFPSLDPRVETISTGDAKTFAERYHRYFDNMRDNGVSVLAAICLGSTHASLFSESEGHYARVTRSRLTPEGLTIVDALDTLYGRPASLVTYLDT